MTKTSSDALDPPTLPHGQGISARPQADPYRALRDPPSEFGAGRRWIGRGRAGGGRGASRSDPAAHQSP